MDHELGSNSVELVVEALVGNVGLEPELLRVRGSGWGPLLQVGEIEAQLLDFESVKEGPGFDKQLPTDK